MKNAIAFLLFFTVVHSFSQEKPVDSIKPTESHNKGFSFRPVSRIYYILPQQFGDHALADAHSTSWGIGTNVSFFKYNNFRFGLGLEFSQYSVNDMSKVGNFTHSNSKALYFTLSYDVRFSTKTTLVPNAGFGFSSVKQKSDSQSFGEYDGTHFRFGTHLDIAVHRHLGVFAGIHYINSSFDIKTNAAYRDYFGKSQQLQLTLGLKFH